VDKARHLQVAFASWLASNGDGDEFISQWLASWIICSEMNVVDLFESIEDRFFNRIIWLMMHQDQIWDGLLPGGPLDSQTIKMIGSIEDLVSEIPTIDVVLLATDLYGSEMLAVDRKGQVGVIKDPFFTNLSNPDAGEVSAGDNLRIVLSNWQPLDGSEIHDLLN
jgi:hypothetical protein